MSDLISKRELYHKLGEVYYKGYLSWGVNEIVKELIGECDSVENKGDLISRQAVLDAIQKLNIPEDMCVFEIISHIEVEIATLPSVEKCFDGMTNREIISEFVKHDDSFATMVDEVNGTVNIELSLDFWNAPYKAESEETNMSKDEAIKILAAIRSDAIQGTCYVTESSAEALEMAIEALKR